MLKVSGQPNPQPIYLASFALDGVEVEQCLGGVLAHAVSGVDERDRRACGGFLRRAGRRVALDDDVGVAGYDARSVG